MELTNKAAARDCQCRIDARGASMGESNGDFVGRSTTAIIATRSDDNSGGTSKLITNIIPQKKFDKVCMVLAEVLGTGSLLFFGCAGTIHWDGPPTSILPPLNFGLTVMMIIQIFGHISFALLNPAVNIAAVVYNQITWQMGIILTVAQVVGAVLGFGLLKYITPEDIFNMDPRGVCMTLPHPKMGVVGSFFIEFFLTSALISMICGVWDPRNRKNGDSAPLRIGLAIVALSLAGGPFTDASMNPVRSLGPALWNWKWDHHWIFWVSPPLAGLLASCFYRFVFWRRNPDDNLPDTLPIAFAAKTEL